MRGRLGALAGERADLDGRLASLDQALPHYDAELNRCRQMLADTEGHLEEERRAVSLAEAAQRETAERELELRAALVSGSTMLSAARDVVRTLKSRAQRIVP